MSESAGDTAFLAAFWALQRRDAGVAAPSPPPPPPAPSRKRMSLTEEQTLVRRFQDGDRSAANALLRAHETLIRRVGKADDDRMQAARLALLRAAARHDYKGGVRLATYAGRYAWWKSATEYERHHRRRRRCTHASLDDPIGQDDERPIGSRIAWPGATPEQLLIALESYGLWVWR